MINKNLNHISSNVVIWFYFYHKKKVITYCTRSFFSCK